MVRQPLEMRRLRLLLELKHRGTITAVAEAMSYTQSAVSQQLSMLASEVGVPLLEADGRRRRLTPQAEILVEHARTILAELDLAHANIAASIGEISGTYRVASFQTVTLAWLPFVMTELKAAHPGLRVEIVQAEPEAATPGLLMREFDAVIAETYPGQPRRPAAGTEEWPICTDPMRIASRPGIDDPSAPLSALRAAPFIMEPEGSNAREWAVSTCRNAGFEPDIIVATDDMRAQVRFVERGLGVAFLPDLVWFDTPPPKQLVRVSEREILLRIRTGYSGHPAVAAMHHAIQSANTTVRRAIRGRLAKPDD